MSSRKTTRCSLLFVISLHLLPTNVLTIELQVTSQLEGCTKILSSNAFQFERPVTDARKALDHAKAETIRRGGTWEGDLDRGSYHMRTPFGALEGTYQVVQHKVLFAIQRKPALVPCALIATIIDQFI